MKRGGEGHHGRRGDVGGRAPSLRLMSGVRGGACQRFSTEGWRGAPRLRGGVGGGSTRARGVCIPG